MFSKDFAGPEYHLYALLTLPSQHFHVSCLVGGMFEAFADAKPKVGDDKMAQRVKSLPNLN